MDKDKNSSFMSNSNIRKNSQNDDGNNIENGHDDNSIITATTNNENLTKPGIRVSECDLVFIVISIIQRIIAVGLNIYVAYDYYKLEKFNYFIWTICFILIPLIITTFVYLTMFQQDQKTTSKYKKLNNCEIFLYIIIFPMIFRYAKSFYYSLKCKNAENHKNIIKQRRYYKLMIQEENDIALIRLFECFLDAAPQKILQIFIIIKQENGENILWSQYAAIIGCFFSLSWSMVTYNKYNRFGQSDKLLLSMQACIFQTLWYFSTTISRILCISMLICLYPIPTIILYLIHSLVCSIILIFYDKLEFCTNNKFKSICFCLIFGLTYIFVYIMPKDGVPTKLRYIYYYTICIFENVISLGIFIYFSPENIRNYFLFIPICILSNLLYIIGIMFMIIYYLYFHPKAQK